MSKVETRNILFASADHETRVHRNRKYHSRINLFAITYYYDQRRSFENCDMEVVFIVVRFLPLCKA